MLINNLPFHIGASDAESNPAGVPNVLDFELAIDNKLSLLYQNIGDNVLQALEKSYCFGKLIGTPLSESDDGKPYADDFLNLILNESPGNKILEIGCGKGYLLKRLQDKSFSCLGIEPGKGYSNFWKSYNVNVINDFFPTSKDKSNYDLIFGYMLLEHINNPIEFIKKVRCRLNHNGMAIFAVPDCTEEIMRSDPAILIHEHISYFDENSLSNLFKIAGMNPKVYKSGYGRNLYVVATLANDNIDLEINHSNINKLKNYLVNVNENILKQKKIISGILSESSVGIYCPSRAINILSAEQDYRFFDDDPYMYGKYLPPFKSQIENYHDCLANPPENIVVASRTFFIKIKEKLIKGGFNGKIINLFE